MTTELTCIECPIGCSIEVEIAGDEIKVSGNGCPRGKKYAESEVVCPMRIVTSSVRAEDGRMLSVKTDPVRRSEMFEVIRKINSVHPKAPVAIGDVLVPDIDGRGARLLATSPLMPHC